MLIYKITNKINGKVYIGQTVQKLNKRWKRHKQESVRSFSKRNPQAIHSAIAKYGKENFTIEQIDSACTRSDLNKKEIYWISYFNTQVPNGYNISAGGNSSEISIETRKRMSEAGKGNLTQAKLRPVVYLKDPNGQIWAIKSLNAFEKKYLFTMRKLSDVVRGIRTFANGWSKPSESDLTSCKYMEYFTPFIDIHHDVVFSRNRKTHSMSVEGLTKRSAKLRQKWQDKKYQEKQQVTRGKWYLVTDVNNKETVVKNLTLFCNKNGIKPAMLMRVVYGKRKSHKGYRVSRLPNLINRKLEE